MKNIQVSSNISILVALTVLIISAVILAMYVLDEQKLASYGSILGASGSFIAIIWFTGSLWYQAQQLKEQRIQFLEMFQKTEEDGRRSALLLARDILYAAETRALSLNSDISSISQLVPVYANFVELKEIMESEDPVIVQEAVTNWLKKEGPAVALMKGIKSAAQVYFVSIGMKGIDYTMEPDDFVFNYGVHLWRLPFFESFHGTAAMLVEIMIRLQPGRKSAILANWGVMVASGNESLLKMEVIRKDIKEHREKGYTVPKIAELL